MKGVNERTMRRRGSTPPKLVTRFLEWYCREDKIEQISGDLHEIYCRDALAGKRFYAGLRYAWNVLRFFRLSNLKKGDRFTPEPASMLKHYFKLGIRNLVSNRNYSLINVTGLAIGITTVLLITLFIRMEFSYDLFHEHHQNIYRLVRSNNDAGTDGLARIPGPVAPLLKQQLPGVKETVRVMNSSALLFSANGKKAYEQQGYYADSTIFDVFTFKVLSGDPRRMLRSPDGIVLTESLAARYFGERSPLGALIVLNNNTTVHVTGVLEDVPFNSHFRFEYLLPMSAERTGWIDQWDRPQYYTYVRMDNGSIDLAANEAAILELVYPHVPPERRNFNVSLQPLTSIHLHSGLFREMAPNGSMNAIYIAISVALIVLLVAGINYTTIFTARASERLKEIGMRKVAGARKGELIRQFLSEAIMLTLLASVVALGITYLVTPYFSSLMNTSLDMSAFRDPVFVTAAIGGVLLVAIAAGAYPAFYLSSINAITLQRGISVHRRSYTRHALVFVQLMVSAFLVASLSIVRQQTDFIRSKDLGFDSDNIMTIAIRDPETVSRMDAVRIQLSSTAHVGDVSFVATLLGGADWGMPVKPEGIADEDVPPTRVLVADENFIDTYGMHIVRGRNFSAAHQSDERSAVLINETAARAYGWLHDPIGKKIEIAPMGRSAEVVGVVRDFHFRSLHEEIQPIVFFMGREFYTSVSLRLSGTPDPEVINSITRLWSSIEPEYPVTWSFVDDTLDRLYRSEQRTQWLVTWAGGLALVLACVGLFSLTAYESSLRSREFGIRKVLGASVGQILGIQLKGYLIVAAAGSLLACGVAWWVMNEWLSEFAYRVALGPLSFLTSIVLTVVVTIATASVQSIRSALVNPVQSIRTTA